MRNVLFGILAVFMFSASADACQRCGFRGRNCRFFSTQHVEHIDKHYSANTADVYVINNQYAGPLVGQGTLQYRSASYQQSVLPLLDPAAYFSQEQELIRAAQDANALRIEKSLEVFERTAELYSPVAEKLAAGQAAKMVLDAAGLSGGASGEAYSQHSAVVITKDEYGRIVIGKLSQDQILSLNKKIDSKTQPNEASNKYPLLSQYCSKCHGTSVAQPKGSLHLGDDPNVAKTMRAKFFDIESSVRDKAMPPASEPQPSNAERDGIVREIKSIITAHAQE